MSGTALLSDPSACHPSRDCVTQELHRACAEMSGRWPRDGCFRGCAGEVLEKVYDSARHQDRQRPQRACFHSRAPPSQACGPAGPARLPRAL